MDDWRSYDDVAITYERVHAPRFAEPARDLLGAGRRRTPASACSTSAPAPASPRRSPAGLGVDAVGVDASPGMLEVAHARPPRAPPRGSRSDRPALPGRVRSTPWSARSCSPTSPRWTPPCSTSSASPGPAARVGFSAWADGRDAFSDTWLELVTEVVPKELLEPSIAKAIPNHDRFTKRQAIELALLDAGLRHVRTEPARYEWSYSLERLPRRARGLGRRPVRAGDARRHGVGRFPRARPVGLRRPVPRSAARSARRAAGDRREGVVSSDRGRGTPRRSSTPIFSPDAVASLRIDSSKKRMPSVSWLACARERVDLRVEERRVTSSVRLGSFVQPSHTS